MSDETIGQLHDALTPGESTTRRFFGQTWEITRVDTKRDHKVCASVLIDLPCGCQDVHYECGGVDYEHDHVECGGTP